MNTSKIADARGSNAPVRRRRWPLALGAAAGLLLLLIVALAALGPTIAESILPRLAADAPIQGGLAVHGVDLSWRGPQRIGPVELRDPEGALVGTLRADASASLLSLVFGSRDIGVVTLGGRIEVATGPDGSTNLARALAARNGAAGSPSGTGSGSGGGGARVPEGLKGEVRLDALEVVYKNAEVEQRAGGPVGARNITGALAFGTGEPLTLELHADPLRGGGPLAVRATVLNVLAADGRVTPELARVDAKASGTVDAALLDALAGLKGALGDASGGLMSVELDARGGMDAGTGTLVLRSAAEGGPSADLSLAVKDGRLSASGPNVVRLAVTPATAARLLAQPHGFTLEKPVSVTATIDALDVPLPKGGKGLNLRGARLSALVETSAVEGAMAGLGDGPARAVALSPIAMRLDAPDLNGTVSLVAGTTARFDGAAAGELAVDLRASGLLDEQGGLRGGAPELDGEARATGVAAAIAQPFVDRFGVVLARDIGPTMDLTLVARSAAGAPGSAGPTETSLSATLKAAQLDASVEARLEASRVRSAGSGLVVRAASPASLLTAVARSSGARFSGAGPATLSAPVFDVPLEQGKPLPGRASATMALEAGGMTVHMKEGSAPIEIARLEASGALKPGGDLVARLAGEQAYRGKPFTARGDLSIGGLARPDGSLGFAGARPSGAVTVDSLPTALLEQFVPKEDAELTRAAIGDTIRAAATAAPGAGGTSDIKLELVSERLDARAEGSLTPGKSVALRSGGAKLTLDPAVATAALRRFAPDVQGAPKLGAPVRAEVALAPATIPFDSAGKLDLKGAGPIEATLALSNDLVLVGLPAGGEDATRKTIDLGARGVKALVRSSLGEGGERSGKASMGLFDPREPGVMIASAELDASMTGGAIDAKARVADIDSRRVDALLGRPELLEGLVGSPANLTVSAQRASATALMTARAGVQAPRLTLDAQANVTEDRVELAAPLAAQWTMEEGWANLHVAPAGQDGAPGALRFAGPTALSVSVDRLAVGLQGRPMRPDVFALEARASAPSISIVSAGGKEFVYQNVSATIGAADAGGVRVRVNASERMGSKVALDAQATGLADSAGALTTGKAELSLQLDGQLPGAAVDAMVSGRGIVHEALGDVVNVRARADRLSRTGGSVSARAESERAKAEFVGVVEDGVLRTTQPMFAELSVITPELGQLAFTRVLPLLGTLEKRSADGPAALRAEGLTLPLDGDLTALNGRVTLELGRVQYTAAPFFGDLLAFARQRKESSLLRDWPPVVVMIEKGVATYDKVVFPIGEFQLATEGTVDMVQRKAELVTWVPIVALVDEVAAIANRLPGVTRATMFPLRTRGRFGALKTEPAPELLAKSLLEAPGDILEDLFKRIERRKDEKK